MKSKQPSSRTWPTRPGSSEKEPGSFHCHGDRVQNHRRMMSGIQSQILKAVYETAGDLYRLGLIDRHRMRFYEEICQGKAPEGAAAVIDTKTQTGQPDKKEEDLGGFFASARNFFAVR